MTHTPPSPVSGYALSGCGCLLTLAGVLTALFGAFHVFLDQGGAISGEEAAPALIGGACCTVPSLALLGGGVFLALRARKAAEAVEPPKPL